MAGDAKLDFDLEVVLRGFTECQGNDSELKLVGYLYAFTELTRFFRMMGRVFGFVANDLQSKLNILTNLEKNSDKNRTIQSLMAHEKDINQKTGSNCVLELHWALEFIGIFMEDVASASNEAKTSEIAASAYKRTLANHHNWLVQKMAIVAVYTLPRRDTLIHMMCKQDSEEVVTLLNEVVKEIKVVCQVTETTLQEYGLGNVDSTFHMERSQSI